MVSTLAAIRNFLVTVADVLDTVYFKLAQILGLSKRIGERLSIIYLGVASVFVFTILISLIVSIASTAKSKSGEPEPVITTANAISTSTTVTPDKTQSASVSLTYPHTTVTSKPPLTLFVTTTRNRQTSTTPRTPPSTTTQSKPQTSSSRSTRRSSITTTTTTRKPQTSSSSSTRITSPATTIKPPENPVHCMFVADVLNLGKDSTAITQYFEEKELIFQIAESVINWYDGNTVASWAYGHVKPTSFRQRFESFTNDWQKFAEYTHELMTLYNNSLSPSVGNDEVFSEINENGDLDRKANCLVFLSAMTNTTGYTIKPKYEHYKRIVVVNLAGGNFGKILDDNRGTLVSVTQPYNGGESGSRENRNKVFKAILEGFLK
ncbi:unnamed protein product [Cylicocyclus nassatus]|uniref:Uncharacterized protein n=1 Tax=Cylicocyclus nassatus TaxID=53992 RepID=A0AA36MD32_CYLNA|nr:unnamed protein product [Cylicocyclus nassatus]